MDPKWSFKIDLPTLSILQGLDSLHRNWLGPQQGCYKEVVVTPLQALTFLSSKSSPPKRGEDSICPVISSHVKTSEHLRGCDGLRVHPHLLVGLAAVRHGLHQCVDTAGLADPAGTQDHHTVTYTLGLKQLEKFSSLLSR